MVCRELKAKGVDLYLHKQGLDTSTPAGKAMFQMLGVFAEFEREIIRERVIAGLDRARESGTKSGRPFGRPEVFSVVRDRVIELREEGQSIRGIAATLEISKATVQKALKVSDT